MRRCEYCKGILWPWQKRLGFSFHYDCRIYVEALWKQSQEQYEHDAEWHRNERPWRRVPQPSTPTEEARVTTEAQRLIEAATPLPWGLIGQTIAKGLHSVARAESDGGDPIHGELTDEQMEDEELANAALIVYAVNRLPAYEAAVEALDELIHHFRPDTVEKGLAALACLREGAGEASSQPSS